MINDLIKYYSSDLTFTSLVTRQHGVFKNTLFYLALAIAVSTPIIALTTKIQWITLGVIPCMALTIYVAIRINASTIKKLYPDIYRTKTSWSHKQFDSLIFEKLEGYLKEYSTIRIMHCLEYPP